MLLLCVFYFLSLLLDVMGRQVPLQVQVGDLYVGGGCEKIPESVVEDDLATVFGVLETLLQNILVNKLGHLGARNELSIGKGKERAQLRRDFLLPVKPVVFSTLLRLFTVRILLSGLDLTDEFRKRLNLGAESGDIRLNVFKGHYTYLRGLIFKSWNTRKNNVIIVKKPRR